MPAIAPSYIYAFFALTIIATILISSFSAHMTTLRTIPEIQQLKNILEHVASQASNLITLTETTNSTSRIILRMPSAIGNKLYWFRLQNNSSDAWIEGALGTLHQHKAMYQISLPKVVNAFGNYSSSHGPALLESYNAGVNVLHLTSWSEKT